ncbi:putative amidohydrolase YtcJ [Cytobacillus horneckiae]
MNGRRDARHALEHIEVITPEIPRFKELGVYRQFSRTIWS